MCSACCIISQKTGALQYYSQDSQTGDNIGVWTENLNGTNVLAVDGRPTMIKQDGKIQATIGADGKPL